MCPARSGDDYLLDVPWDECDERVERAANLRTERQRRYAEEMRVRVAVERKAKHESETKQRQKDCGEAHDGNHPWVLSISIGDVELKCKLCRMDHPDLQGYIEMIDFSERVQVELVNEGGSGEDAEVYLRCHIVHPRDRAHTHQWIFYPGGDHQCIGWNECDAFHSASSCYRPCGDYARKTEHLRKARPDQIERPKSNKEIEREMS